jgi:hypothetical protein
MKWVDVAGDFDWCQRCFFFFTPSIKHHSWGTVVAGTGGDKYVVGISPFFLEYRRKEEKKGPQWTSRDFAGAEGMSVLYLLLVYVGCVGICSANCIGCSTYVFYNLEHLAISCIMCIHNSKSIAST